MEMYGLVPTTVKRGLLYLKVPLNLLDPRVEQKNHTKNYPPALSPPPPHSVYFWWLTCQEHYGHKPDGMEIQQVESYCIHSDGPSIQIPVGSCQQIITFQIVTQIQRASHLWGQLEPQEALPKGWGKQQQQYSKHFMKQKLRFHLRNIKAKLALTDRRDLYYSTQLHLKRQIF